jgi:hypothetical protein
MSRMLKIENRQFSCKVVELYMDRFVLTSRFLNCSFFEIWLTFTKVILKFRQYHAPFWFSGNNFVKKGQIFKNRTFAVRPFLTTLNFWWFSKTTPTFTGKTGNISGTAGWKFMKFEQDVPKDMTFNMCYTSNSDFSFCPIPLVIWYFFWFYRKIQDGRQLQNTPVWFKIERAFQICNRIQRSSKIVDDIAKFQKSLLP